MARIFTLALLAGAWLLLAGALAACGNTYETDDDSAAGDDDAGDDDTGGLPPAISAVEPSTGAPTGGYTANVYGSNYTDAADTQILFGTTEAEVVGCGPGMCTVLVPAAASEGAVDVSLTNANGSDTLVAGFTYQTDLSGTVSYYATLTRLEYLYPGVYKPPAVSETYASAKFFEPEQLDVMRDVLWGGVLPSLGTCAEYDRNNDWVTPSVWALGAGISVDLVGPTTYTLEKDWSTYVASGMALEDYVPGSYMLDIAGGSDLQPEQIPNALVAPPVVTMIPAWAGEYMSLVDFTSGLSATLSEPCDETVFNVDIYDTMAAYAGSIVCYSASTDTLTMDAALLANYTSAYIVVVRADCCSVTSNQVYSGSKMVGVGRSILSGAIYIQ